MKKSNKDLFIAIDGNALVHRAFHAYPPTLTTSDGLQVNAVYGFTVMLLAMLKQFDPKYVVCTFDTAAPTFRHAKYAEYKGTRKAPEQTLIDQFPLVEEVVKSLNIPILKKEGYEADDLLGTLSEWVRTGKWSVYDFDMYLLTGDKDLLQLISERVGVCMPIGSFSNLVVYDREATFQKYGYYPEQVVDYKGLVGDPSDNIPGIKGVGGKTALGLLKQFNTLGGIYENLSKVKPRYAKLIRDGVEQMEMSREIATIKKDVDFILELDGCILSDFDVDSVVSLFRKLEFRSLISKIPSSSREKPKAGQLGMFAVGDEDSSDAVAVIEKPVLKIVAYIGEQESEDKGFFIETLFDGENISTKTVERFTKLTGCETYVYNFEDACGKEGFVNSYTWDNEIDIKLLAYHLSSGKKSYNLSDIAFDLTAKTIPEKIGRNDIKKVGSVLVDCVLELKKKMKESNDTEYVRNWVTYLQNRFKVSGITHFELISKYLDIPVAKILSKMEKRGISLNITKLIELNTVLDQSIEKLSQSIYEDIGHEFNLNSPKQLSDVLYVELGLPIVDGKTTREDVLLELKSMHPCIEKILEYREINKLLGTYVKPYLEISKKDGVSEIHTDFKQTGSSSGRFSSINPNMQNLPIKGIWADKIREVFIPRDGFIFVGADYSQIEFRVMADISNDSALISDFNNGKDIHLTTAARIFNKDEKEVTKEERYLGKTINFAILFGQTPFGLSKLINVPPEVAKKYIEEYFKEYSGVAKYIEKSKSDATKYGYVQSMFGRTRYISGLSSKNRNVYNAAVREAINMPIQGGEADIMRLAMVDIDKLIQKKYTESAHILLQVHDEFIFEVRNDLADDFSKDIYDLMKNVVPLNVPLDVHISKGIDMSKLK